MNSPTRPGGFILPADLPLGSTPQTCTPGHQHRMRPDADRCYCGKWTKEAALALGYPSLQAALAQDPPTETP